MINNDIESTDAHSNGTDTPDLLRLPYREIRLQQKKNKRFIALSSAPVLWLDTMMVTASIGLMIYVGFSKELFFAGEKNSEFVFAVTMCVVLAIWYLRVANQLIKNRNIEFFANDDGVYISANRSKNDYFFLPWQRVKNHVVAKGYYNGSAAAITFHTDFRHIPEAIIERGSSLGVLENSGTNFSVIPRSFVKHHEMEEKLNTLRGVEPPVDVTHTL